MRAEIERRLTDRASKFGHAEIDLSTFADTIPTHVKKAKPPPPKPKSVCASVVRSGRCLVLTPPFSLPTNAENKNPDAVAPSWRRPCACWRTGRRHNSSWGSNCRSRSARTPPSACETSLCVCTALDLCGGRFWTLQRVALALALALALASVLAAHTPALGLAPPCPPCPKPTLPPCWRRTPRKTSWDPCQRSLGRRRRTPGQSLAA